MQYSTQHWYDIRAYLEVVQAGVGLTGAQPQVAVLRLNDAKWYDPGANDFTSATRIWDAMIEADATNQPGVYVYEPAAASLTRPEGLAQDGYLVVCWYAAHKILEHTRVHVANQQAWAATRSDYTVVGTFGEYVNTDVWETDLSPYTDPAKAGTVLRNVARLLGLGESANADFRHVSTNSSPTTNGKFYAAASCPSPSADVTIAYAGRRAVLRRASDNRSISCTVNSVANDGADHFQLEMIDGTAWSLTITAGDELFIQVSIGESDAALTPGDVWDVLASGHTAAGTFGDQFRRMLSLRQQNVRVVYSAWNAAHVPTAGTIYIYPTKVAMDADAGGTGVGAFGSYEFGATFSADLEPTVYTSGKLT